MLEQVCQRGRERFSYGTFLNLFRFPGRITRRARSAPSTGCPLAHSGAARQAKRFSRGAIAQWHFFFRRFPPEFFEVPVGPFFAAFRALRIFSPDRRSKKLLYPVSYDITKSYAHIAAIMAAPAG